MPFNSNSAEVRMFVRHSDGSSLVVPEQPHGIRELSFRLAIPLETPAETRLAVIEHERSKEECQDLGFIALQRYLGSETSFERRDSGVDIIYAHGYLGQLNIGKVIGEGTGRQVLPLLDAQTIMDVSPDIDSLDRRLVYRALEKIRMDSAAA